MKIIEKMKRMLKRRKPKTEYWININQIHVNPAWRQTKIGSKKFRRKMKYWYRTGEFESKIILDKDFNLIDGYSSVRIAEIKGIIKLPVYFVD